MGSLNEKKYDDHQKKKFLLNNSIEDLSPLREEHQDLLKVHVLSFRDQEFSVWGQIFKNRIFCEVEKCGVRKRFRTY